MIKRTINLNGINKTVVADPGKPRWQTWCVRNWG